MDGRFNTHPFVSGQEEPGTTTENVPGATVSGGKTTAISSPKRRRDVQKRVLSVPIGEVDGSKLKGEAAPPSDSWAWRKYGQKPIKGSPYPRGYYRCSSWKGCPARKQVERSRTDPTMLVITYACDHNHPLLTSKNPTTTAAAAASPDRNFSSEEPAVFAGPTAIETDDRFADLETDHTLLLPSSPSKSSIPNPPSIPKTLESWDLPAFPFPQSEPILVSSPCSYGAHLDGLRDCSESLPTLPSPPQWGHFHFMVQSSWEFQSEVTPSDQLRSGIQWNPSTVQQHHHYRLQQQQIIVGGIFLLGCSVEWWQLFWLDLLLFDDSYVPCIWIP